jgi:hypothetical protein
VCFAEFKCFAILARLGLVAQSVEQRIENPCVGGSIPPRATKKIKGLASAKPFFYPRLANAPAYAPLLLKRDYPFRSLFRLI